MKKLTGAFFLVMLLVMGACKKDAVNPFSIQGKVTDARNGSGLAGVAIKVDKQAIQNGVYTNTFERALTTTTGSDGNYSGSWERETFTTLKLSAEKPNYIPIETELSEQEVGSGDINKNISMYSEAFVSLRFRHQSTNSNDRLLFNYTNTNFDCACCKPGWKAITGAQVDTTFTCRVYGDHWLFFEVITEINNIDSAYTDSIYCPAFIETSYEVLY